MFKTPNVCKDCDRYDSVEDNCKDKKINPRSKKTTIKVAGAFGDESICDKNEWKKGL